VTTPSTNPPRRLGDADQLAEGSVNPYYLADLKQRTSVARVDGRLYAFGDLCPNDQCPLSAGLLTGTTIMCQCDGSRFDITTGAVLNGPAVAPLEVFGVVESDGGILVNI
jgi:3-phenylpropionate/trans-cinnamate dioxygenase ferredoxin component